MIRRPIRRNQVTKTDRDMEVVVAVKHGGGLIPSLVHRDCTNTRYDIVLPDKEEGANNPANRDAECG